MTQEDVGFIQKLFTKVKEISALWIPNKEPFGNSTYSENLQLELCSVSSHEHKNKKKGIAI